MYRLKIELMSDLCVASGDGYASVIDTDVVTDDQGVPFIPARRLKGCLREAAIYINTDQKIIDSIFGVSKDIKAGSLRLGDAVLEEHDVLISQLSDYSAKYITELFTNTLACTAIDTDGLVKDNSLRFVRMVDRKLPWDTSRNIVFYSDVIIDDNLICEFERICKALHHIGFKRTRGFGVVRCSLEKNELNKGVSIDLSSMAPGKKYQLDYAIKLEEDLMLPSSSADKTMDYISGQAVIGMLAAEYLKDNLADETFDKLFLSGETIYSNLYITDDELSEYIPTPVSFGKRKGYEKVIDLTDDDSRNGTEKPIKKGYMSGEMETRSVETRIVYHNSPKQKGLYTQLCICKGQKLRGSIISEYENIKYIADVLSRNEIFFGRSKSAQYSKCSIVSAKISEYKVKELNIEEGDIVIYSFESDAIISDNHGSTSHSFDKVINALGISGDILPASALKYETLSGYVSVMRMQRPHIRAVSAGSAIAVKAKKNDKVATVMYVGEKQGEGFGKVRVFKQNRLNESMGNKLAASKAVVQCNDSIKMIIERIQYADKMKGDAVRFARGYKEKFINKWNPAFIGRVALMVEESSDMTNLNKRIKSIKSNNKRNYASDLIKHSEMNHFVGWANQKEYLLLILQLAKYMVKQGGKSVK
ncbi:MAG: hypothetical protein IKH75_10600 [Ruminococcus sp.]|nr:hypothetical protein [Ruminococcus sp.]